MLEVLVQVVMVIVSLPIADACQQLFKVRGVPVLSVAPHLAHRRCYRTACYMNAREEEI